MKKRPKKYLKRQKTQDNPKIYKPSNIYTL